MDNKFLSLRLFFFIGVSAIFFVTPAFAKNSVTIKNDWFYVNGEKFFVKGINYAAYRPGQSPSDKDKINLNLVDDDFRLIKEAGFNTIRTAGALSPQIESLAQKHGLFILHGIWFDKNTDYTNPDTLSYAENLLMQDLKWAKDYDNVLGYLFLNEPPMERVRDAGKKKTEDFLKNLTVFVKSVDVQRPASFSNWVPLGFIDHSFLDFVAFNAYIYSPGIITNSFGYFGYIQWLKQHIAGDKPLIITEFGLSTSKIHKGNQVSGFYGYGGNSLQEQAQGTIKMYDQLIEAGATGGCAFSWNDDLWLTGSKYVQEEDPEEYYGITEFGKDGRAIAKPAYSALKEYNQALVIQPKSTNFYSGSMPLEIYATEKAARVQFNLDGQQWQDLTKEGMFWWKENVDVVKLSAGKHVLEIQAIDKKKNILCRKTKNIWIGAIGDNAPYVITIQTDKQEYSSDEKVQITISVKDSKGNPIAGQTVDCAVFQAIGWSDHIFNLTTDEKGQATKEFMPFMTGYMSVSAGIEYKQADGFTQRYADQKTILIQGH